MYIVQRAYDDKTADILDLGNYATKHFEERELIRFASNHDVMGLSVSDNKINYISAYSITSFPVESEATEYCYEHGLSYQSKMNLLGYWWVFEKTYITFHVAYYIRTAKEVDNVYLGENNTYTPYIQSAREFSKKEAQKKVVMMNRNPRAAQHWMIERVVIGG